MLLISFLAAVPVRGEEPGAATVRQKLHAKIMESVPPPPPAKPSGEKKEDEDAAGSVVVMKPFVVSESKSDRNVAAAMARESQKEKEEKFSLAKGGTLYRKDIGNRRIEIGGWWTAGKGWEFLKISW